MNKRSHNIEIRAGKLEISGGTIAGDTDNFEDEEDGNGGGTTVDDGAALAIVQHTTGNDIEVTISDGTLSGYYAIFEANLQHNESIYRDITIAISGGTFNGWISS